MGRVQPDVTGFSKLQVETSANVKQRFNPALVVRPEFGRMLIHLTDLELVMAQRYLPSLGDMITLQPTGEDTNICFCFH